MHPDRPTAPPGEHDRGPALGDLGDRLRQVLVDASRERPTVLVVDLLYVTFIDLTGIGPLGYNAGRRLGVRFTIRRPSPFIVTQLRQTGLYDMLTADR